MTRTLIIVAACTGLIAIGLIVWLISDSGGRSERAWEFFNTPAELDTTGGQEMRPRWSAGEGQGDEATKN